MKKILALVLTLTMIFALSVPAFAAKAYVGAFYRINDSWSVGLSGSFLWIPQVFADKPKYNYHGLFTTAGLAMRYHF